MALLRRCAKLLEGWETYAAETADMARGWTAPSALQRGSRPC